MPRKARLIHLLTVEFQGRTAAAELALEMATLREQVVETTQNPELEPGAARRTASAPAAQQVQAENQALAEGRVPDQLPAPAPAMALPEQALEAVHQRVSQFPVVFPGAAAPRSQEPYRSIARMA